MVLLIWVEMQMKAQQFWFSDLFVDYGTRQGIDPGWSLNPDTDKPVVMLIPYFLVSRREALTTNFKDFCVTLVYGSCPP